MIEWRIRPVAMLALALAGAALVPAAGARNADTYQIVGGTWVSGWSGQLVGPAWWLDGPTSTYGVTMVGPDGFTKHMGGPNQRFPGMPSTRSLYWCNTTCGEQNLGGSWYAIGDGDHTKVSFSIDSSSRMQPVVVGQYSGDATTFTANWTADPNAKSFIVYIQDEGDQSATDWTAGQVLPGTATTVTFSNLSLDPDWAYEFDIFAFSGDIAAGPAPAVFNVASNRVDFVPSVLAAHGPMSGLPRSPCYGSISCCGSAAPCSTHGGPLCCDIISPPPSSGVLRTCALEGAASGWSLSANRSTPCKTARTVLVSYLASNKCRPASKKPSQGCSTASYKCASSAANKRTTVRCTSVKGRRIVFESSI